MKTSLKFPILVGVFVLSTLLAASSRPQSEPARSTAEKSISAAPVAILAGRLIDVRTGHVTTNAYIVVEKDRIAGIVVGPGRRETHRPFQIHRRSRTD